MLAFVFIFMPTFVVIFICTFRIIENPTKAHIRMRFNNCRESDCSQILIFSCFLDIWIQRSSGEWSSEGGLCLGAPCRTTKKFVWLWSVMQLSTLTLALGCTLLNFCKLRLQKIRAFDAMRYDVYQCSHAYLCVGEADKVAGRWRL